VAPTELLDRPRPSRALAPSAQRGHVLQVFEPDWGGVPVYVAGLVEGLCERGWGVTVVAPQRPRGGPSPDGRPATLELALRRMRTAGAEIVPFGPRALLAARRARADLVHAHSSKAGALVAGLARAAGVPSVYSPHAWPFQMRRARAARAAFCVAERASARWGHRAAIAVSHGEAEAGRERGVRPRLGISVVRTGLASGRAAPPRDTARRVLGLPREAVVAAWVGRHARQKRPEDLAPLAAAVGPGVLLAALGDGLEGTPEARALEASGGLVLADRTPPDVLYAAADLFVQTSAYEGFPLTVLEAMRAGLPVLAYGVEGLAEQVVDGESGHLVAPGDVEALAARVSALGPGRRGAAERERLGEAGRRRVAEQFDRERMLDGVEAVYERVIRSG
jgi:glycosyltransferase involved in cell wall biosynthesis